MKTRLVQIGNSRGVRLPKAVLEQAGLGDDVELEVQKGSIVISSSARPRAGWAEAAAIMAEQEKNGLLDLPTPTRFDHEEWEW